MENPDGILVRSASMHDMELPESLLAIARAGAGVNNIPVDKCSEAGIVVFNTPGANANAVKELVLCGAAPHLPEDCPGHGLGARPSRARATRSDKLVEKGKGQFAGPEIQGKTLGVIGLGAIGVLVANAASQLGMEVYGYDPYISVERAWRLSTRACTTATTLDEMYQNVRLHHAARAPDHATPRA